jgi:putative transport protein
VKLQFGDVLMCVGGESGLQEAAKEAGDSHRELEHPALLPVVIGIALGVLLGSWPISLPGLPAPVKLGLAGGPLLVAIALSSIGRVGPLVWYLPSSANAALRELGIALFLSAVGLKAGAAFVPALASGDGLRWMAWASLITLLPLVVVAVLAQVLLKLRFGALCGLLSGSMTDPPALAFAQGMTRSDAPALTYATIYPLVMILRILCAQAIVLLFS